VAPKKKLAGVLTALITPFRDGRLDEPTLRSMVRRQLGAGVQGLVVCGSTGEAAAMTLEERLQAVRAVVAEVGGRVPVVAGTGSNNTPATVDLTARARDAGADAALVVTPYYVKPTPRGMVEHFRAVASAGLDLVAYNVPSRTGVSLSPETAAELAGLERVVALKEASGDLWLDTRILAAVGDGLALLSGDDYTFLPCLAIGGQGVISVVSNPAPALFVELHRRFLAGDLQGARALHFRLAPLMKALFLETNPIPVKAAMAALGLCGEEIRLPLTPLSEALRPELARALAAAGLTETRP
jgi:4-hydroxy-tetrahydrodipicolinate synthase